MNPKSTPSAPAPRATGLYLLTLLSAVDGTLLLLGASGQFASLGGSVVVGLTVIAGAGSWIAARELFGGRRLVLADHLLLAGLGLVTLAATLTAVVLGASLGQAVTLHIMPKAAGLLVVLIGLQIAGVSLPRVARMPLPLATMVVAAALEVSIQWTL